MGSFVHLHVHSEFSLLDGLARLPELCQYAARESGMEALALTDHGQMYGTIKFSRAARQAGIKPIYGCEVYQAPRAACISDDGQARSPRLPPRCCWPRIMTGYQNLLQAGHRAPTWRGSTTSRASTRSCWPKHAEGLICLSACISGEVPALAGRGPARRGAPARWAGSKSCLAPSATTWSCSATQGVPELDAHQPATRRGWRSELGLRCVATNDVHYVRQRRCRRPGAVAGHPDQHHTGRPEPHAHGQRRTITWPRPTRWPRCCPSIPRRWRTPLRHRRTLQRGPGVHQAITCPSSTVPAAYTAESYLRTLCEEGLRSALPRAHARDPRSAWSTSWASSTRWALTTISSSTTTWCTGPSTRPRCWWGPGAARAPAAWWPMRWASPTWSRSAWA